MKLYAIIFFSFFVFGTVQAQKQKQGKVFTPETAFDSKVAADALEKGNATIEGVVFVKRNDMSPVARGSKAYGEGVEVVLFPVTDYFKDWYKLRKKKETKINRVYMSEEAVKYSIATKTDSEGNFKFTNLKPGEYFLQTFVGYYTAKSVNHYQGSDWYTSGGTRYITNYYERENYLISNGERIEEFVTVKGENQTVNIKLNKKAPVGGVIE